MCAIRVPHDVWPDGLVGMGRMGLEGWGVEMLGGCQWGPDAWIQWDRSSDVGGGTDSVTWVL